MPNELTRLLKVAPRRPRTTWVAPDLACAALCAILKLLCYRLKYIVLFCRPSPGSFVFFLILCELFSSAVSILWWEVVLSFEAAVFKGAHAASIDSEQSEEATKAGIKANRKATSIPVTFQASLELLVDQSVTTFVAFSKAGYHWLSACGASAAMLSFTLLLQMRYVKFIAEFSAHRRQKETDIGAKTVFLAYMKSSRKLKLWDSCRRISTVIALGSLVINANAHEQQTLALFFPLVLHTDGKLAKLWKSLADAESAWAFLQMQYPLPDQDFHQEATHNSSIHDQPASEVPEIRPRVYVFGTRKVAQLCQILKEGSKYKSETIGITNGLRWRHSGRKNLDNDED